MEFNPWLTTKGQRDSGEIVNYEKPYEPPEMTCYGSWKWMVLPQYFFRPETSSTIAVKSEGLSR